MTAGVGGGGTTWPGVLQTRLDTQYGLGAFTVSNAGVGGQDSTQRLSLLAGYLATYTPDIVIIENGWNDTYHGIGPDTTLANTQVMITAIRATGAHVVIALSHPTCEAYPVYGSSTYPGPVSTPGYTKADTRKWLYDWNNTLIALASSTNPFISAIDFFSVLADTSVTPPANSAYWGNPALYYSGDNLWIHPSATGYTAMANAIDLSIFGRGYGGFTGLSATSGVATLSGYGVSSIAGTGAIMPVSAASGTAGLAGIGQSIGFCDIYGQSLTIYGIDGQPASILPI